MMQLILYSSTLISSFIFMQMNHPLAMGLMLLIQTLQICLMTGLMAKSFWFSYILFLIFLGGMLVLFIYVTSLASNEMFSFSMKLTTICLTNFKCQRCMLFLYLYLFTCSTSDLLWIMFIYSNMISSSTNFIFSYSNSFHSMCITMSTNIFLSSNSYNKFIISNSLPSNYFSTLNLSSICS